MAEIIVHGQVVGNAADASRFEYVPLKEIDWGHLQPGTFRYLFIPRNQLKDDGDDSSSVSSFSDSDDSEHRMEREEKAKKAREFAEQTGTDTGNASRGMSMMSRFAQRNKDRAKEVAKKGAEFFDQEEKAIKAAKQQKKEAKAKREEDADETPPWAKAAGFKLLLRGIVEECGLGVDLEQKKPAEELNHLPEMIGKVISYLNPRRIGRAVRLGRAWANVGYQDPLYYCLVQIGVPAVTIYAFEKRIDAVLNCGDAVLASGASPASVQKETSPFFARSFWRGPRATTSRSRGGALLRDHER